jgi:hypothetical protein
MSEIDPAQQDFIEPHTARDEEPELEVGCDAYHIRLSYVSHTLTGST